MAVGKNKRLSKGGKRSAKKKIGDPMIQKEWHDVVTPAAFTARHCSKTIVNKSKGTFNKDDNLRGRVFELSLADLMEGDEQAYGFRKINLRVEDVQGRNCLTNFHGMSITTDKWRSLMRKWCTTIEATVEAKTHDGYYLRLFCIAFTKRRQTQVSRNCHAQSAHVRRIRQKMTDIITQNVVKSDLQSVVKKLQQEVMGQEISKACSSIFPVRDCILRKVKVTKSPKFDHARLMDAMGGQESIPKSVEGGRTVAPEAPAADVEEADD
eukprot:TRINITY_DN4623_c0_g1_i9.p1 TRINITY_DN4623_c0_g1~~TRINITY_DN4623_c0_g1_i9.p1  ORF type:complete len:301 (+),score=157.50 TRINITY_DN4623_c0_g1_i9:107-904(+)